MERNRELREKLNKKYRHCCQLQKRIDVLEGRVLISQASTSSELAPGITETESDTNTQGITAFADQDPGWQTTMLGAYEQTMDIGNNADSNLGDFLSRPVRVSVESWSVGASKFFKFNPWAAFCEDAFVRDKIKNYELLRCKLNVKMVISGTKFHYGRALVSYNPFTRDDQVTVDRAFGNIDHIAASQKPHFFLNPTTNTGGQLSLPFFYDRNFMSIPAATWDDMGEIVVSSFGTLRHANDGNDPVTITTYVWAEDVVLTMPTSFDPPILISQAGRGKSKRSKSDNKNSMSHQDEYGQGIISKPAAAISKAAGALSNLPVIGPYMTATQIGAGAVGDIASRFGYSRPNIVTDIGLYKPTPCGNLTNTDAADAAQKLTMDSKAELTVDSRTTGLVGEDEMGILDYVKRESYLTKFDWSTAKVSDDLLWNSRVLPMLYDNANGEIHMTPLAHMATAFQQWQGSLKFRFQVVKSDMHKGRLLVRWDPNNFTSEINYNTNYSRVIDLAETDDFEVVVGWGQSVPWRLTGTPQDTGTNFTSASRLAQDTTEGNGVLEITVLNRLVSPGTDANISINVFVSACDDFKLADPTNNKFNALHLFPEVLTSQSSTAEVENALVTDKPTSGDTVVEPIASTTDPDDNTYSVYYGDPPCSIRELCKRYCFTRYWSPFLPAADTHRISTLINKDLPYHTGYDPEGIELAENGTTPITTGSTSFHSWFLPAFAGYRGAMRKKYFFQSNTSQTPVITRGQFVNNASGTFAVNDLATTATSPAVQKWLSSRWSPDSGYGSAATNIGINNTIEVELPYYQPNRFAPARKVRGKNLPCKVHRVRTYSRVDAQQGLNPDDRFSVAYQQHDAVGEDFSLFFFTGIPIYYQYTLNETT